VRVSQLTAVMGMSTVTSNTSCVPLLKTHTEDSAAANATLQQYSTRARNVGNSHGERLSLPWLRKSKPRSRSL
jgi:hypothetical protein